MASHIIGGNPASAQPDDSSEIESVEVREMKEEAYSLSELLHWISSARSVLNELRAIARIRPEVVEAFSGHDFRYNSPEWSTPVDNAHDMLFFRLCSILHKLAKGGE